VRETRINRGKMTFNCRKSLVSTVTENGSGSESWVSYDRVRGKVGQVKLAYRNVTEINNETSNMTSLEIGMSPELN
jgi:hypothetical protein